MTINKVLVVLTLIKYSMIRAIGLNNSDVQLSPLYNKYVYKSDAMVSLLYHADYRVMTGQITSLIAHWNTESLGPTNSPTPSRSYTVCNPAARITGWCHI